MSLGESFVNLIGASLPVIAAGLLAGFAYVVLAVVLARGRRVSGAVWFAPFAMTAAFGGFVLRRFRLSPARQSATTGLCSIIWSH